MDNALLGGLCAFGGAVATALFGAVGKSREIRSTEGTAIVKMLLEERKVQEDRYNTLTDKLERREERIDELERKNAELERELHDARVKIADLEARLTKQEAH
jgi:septal ring factor EnvC (AmiA/AmiB activator)